MEAVLSVLTGFAGILFSPFEYRDPMVSLLPISILAGIGMLWVFGRTSNQLAIRETKNRLKAYMLELRLFTDEPALVWQAQKQLLGANFRLIGLTLRPALVLAVPMVLLLVQMEAFYGRQPLAIGQQAIVTVQMKQPLDATAAAPELQPPDGIRVETQAVRVLDENQVSWRIRALRPLSGALHIVLPNGTVEKSIAAGTGPRYISDRRVSSLAGLVWHPSETLLSNAAVDWIAVSYQPAAVKWLGIQLHWLIWFLIFSMASALLLKRPMGVAF